MRSCFASATISAVILLTGCATGKSNLVLDPVGPAPARAPAVQTTDGTLVVYSAYVTHADSSVLDPDVPEHSDYEIFTADGKLLRRVHNNWGGMLQDAEPVELPAGTYRVFARASRFGMVTVPVVIEAQKRTVLHLEGDNDWLDKSVVNARNAVRLPDGQIIGWRAASTL
jgi:hypothetical protein